MFVVAALVFCAALTIILYNPNWLELLLGLVPQRLSYPEWVPEKYPDIAKYSVWIETTRYVGVIGGAGFDYLAYVSWLRAKQWGVLPAKATADQLAEIAADPHHEVRKWIKAPLVDCAISFGLVVAFSAVFVACGAMILGPQEVVPDEDSLLNLQARFVTQINTLLLPLYVTGAFLTMLGTLYGTIEIAFNIADEIIRSFAQNWTHAKGRKLKRVVLAWCATIALLILGWLFVRQSTPQTAAEQSRADVQDVEAASVGEIPSEEPALLPKPRLLLAILTPVNLFTGVLSCGLICILTIWMDRRELPPSLQPPKWLVALNLFSAVVFLALGIKGYWDNEHRIVVVCTMVGIFVAAMVVAGAIGAKQKSRQPNGKSTTGENKS